MGEIKAKIEEVIKRIQSDPEFMKEFEKNPVKVAEEIVGVDLPDDQINSIIDGVKAKLTLNNGADLLGKLSTDNGTDLLGKIKNLF